MENILENEIKLENNLVNEKEQNNFLETTLGKTINTGIDIGIRALLPDYIEEQIIDFYVTGEADTSVSAFLFLYCL